MALDPRLPEIVGDPWWARRASTSCAPGRSPKVLPDVQAVFVDEVQDLTLVEVALLAALVESASAGRDAPLDVMVAGDESQTVRPTDFDWGAFADAVAPTLGAGTTFDLLGNVRSPRAIATLVERSWALYQHLDKAQRPRGRADLEIEESVSGRVLRCRVPDAATLARGQGPARSAEHRARLPRRAGAARAPARGARRVEQRRREGPRLLRGGPTSFASPSAAPRTP
ncbi:MAG: hypothetical protein IPF99_30870 [Deltaproteobacteria bacterium]|nr:hypothetical protein [Deltaproteobacteria bacterium]